MDWKNPRLIKGALAGVLAIAAIGVWLGKESKSEAGSGKALLSKYAPDYANFANTTGNIERNEVRKALQESLELLKTTQEEPLKAFTRVRIAFLYQTLGEKENERKAWQAIDNKNFALVEESFSCEGSGLRDYARHRIAALGS